MKCLILLAALVCVVLADSCAKPISDKCDQSVLQCCDNNFKTALGAGCNNKQIYENPDCVQNAVNDYFGGETGALKFCNSYNNFRSCLGATARSCTTYQHFLETGSKVELAQTDQGLYSRLTFMCGAGLAYLRNSDAMNPILQEKYEEIRLCGFKFQTRARRDLSKACEYLQEYVSCLQLNFLGIPEAAWYMCELARAYGSPLAPHCEVGCTSTS